MISNLVHARCKSFIYHATQHDFFILLPAPLHVVLALAASGGV